MRLQAPGRIISTLALLPLAASAITLDCEQIQADSVHWDLKALGGLHSVYGIEELSAGGVRNTTFVFDICKNLELDEETHKSCGTGTRICALERHYDSDTEKEPKPEDIWPVAGNFAFSSGHDLDPVFKRIKHSDDANAEDEGVIVTVSGGKHNGEPQRAIIRFVCDRDTTGLDDDEDGKRLVRRADDGDDKKPSSPLKFDGWKPEPSQDKVYGTLRMSWRTKYACEGQAEKEKEKVDASASWGFFTWFIVILFLAISGYLVFGAWLNYNRYGARGWDLLPHGDTIRDVPYILKDWGRRAVNTVQGGSRGGYSAI